MFTVPLLLPRARARHRWPLQPVRHEHAALHAANAQTLTAASAPILCSFIQYLLQITGRIRLSCRPGDGESVRTPGAPRASRWPPWGGSAASGGA